MMMKTKTKRTVAVVGSGMAGLVTAWLLNRDPQARYQVEIFESGSEPSLDFASVSVTDNGTGKDQRIDVPMRAFTEGYYHQLKAMYDYLGVRYEVQPFLFSFSRRSEMEPDSNSQVEEKQYLVHASNHHRLPPIKPKSIGMVTYLKELLFALICYLWFSLCCLLVGTLPGSAGEPCESFDEYLRRIRLPRYFVRYYLLPLMSAVTTCPHKALLDFPAKDVIDYKRCITSGRQLTVAAGVNEVQRKLIGNTRIRCSAEVISVEPQDAKVLVRWREAGVGGVQEQVYDKVVLAVPPNVVGSIFARSKKEMQHFPTISVETIVHRDLSQEVDLDFSVKDQVRKAWFSSPEAGRAHVIRLRTAGRGADLHTEATHVQPCGVMVTSCPLSKRDSTKVISWSRFTRVLRTPESRRRVNRIFDHAGHAGAVDEKGASWKNGDDGVYLVGSWCWDGMVLLEGCVVSAIRAASLLGVQAPWKVS